MPMRPAQHAAEHEHEFTPPRKAAALVK